jgi:hypothetical protein
MFPACSPVTWARRRGRRVSPTPFSMPTAVSSDLGQSALAAFRADRPVGGPRKPNGSRHAWCDTLAAVIRRSRRWRTSMNRLEAARVGAAIHRGGAARDDVAHRRVDRRRSPLRLADGAAQSAARLHQQDGHADSCRRARSHADRLFPTRRRSARRIADRGIGVESRIGDGAATPTSPAPGRGARTAQSRQSLMSRGDRPLRSRSPRSCSRRVSRDAGPSH